jgi:hypothetical protein
VPMAMTLTAPGGVELSADGKLGMIQLALDLKQNRLTADYALTAAQEKNPTCATALFVAGLAQTPVATVNGKELPAAAIGRAELAGKPVFVVPLREGAPPAK